MPSPLFTFSSYLQYRYRAVGAHSLHSPFLYDFYQQVVRAHDRQLEKRLKHIRKTIASAQDNISYRDPRSGINRTVPIHTLAKTAASRHDFSCLLIRLINHMGYQRVLETGTSLGINALYLSHSKAQQISTIEGSSPIAQLARTNFALHAPGQINLITGHVQEVFRQALQQTSPQLVFLDADHRSETIDFYLSEIKRSKQVECIVIHDIYWSPDMKQAWANIIKNPEYNLTIDLFQAGIIFAGYPIEKQHFTLKF